MIEFISSLAAFPDRQLELEGALVGIAGVFAGDVLEEIRTEGLDNAVNDALRSFIEEGIQQINEALVETFARFEVGETGLIIVPDLVVGPFVSLTR